MTRLILHAGLPKTGTTSFQAFAAENTQMLRRRGVAYADGFRDRNHSEIAVAFSHRITPLTRRYGVNDEADRRELRARLPQMLGDPRRAPTILASTEHLTNLLHRRDALAMAAVTLHGLFDEVVVAIVLRRSDYWTPSMYTETVKAGSPRPFDAQFVDRHRRLLDHAKLLQRWRAEFGDENVVAVPFLETDKLEPTALPRRLLSVADCAFGLEPLQAATPLLQNPAPSAYAVELLRRLNAERADTPLRNLDWRYRRVVPTVRREWPGPPQRLSPQAAARLAEHGWIRTGVSNFGRSDAELWDEWSAYSDADTMATPAVTNEDFDKLIELLRKRELIDRSWLRLAPRRARRLARRMLGR